MNSMEVDESSEGGDVLGEMAESGAVVEYCKRHNGIPMGRCLKWTFQMNFFLIPQSEVRQKLLKRFHFFRDDIIVFLDSIDNRVEALRKEALKLQESRDELHTRIDMLKNTDILSNLNESDKEEIGMQLKRINERLQVSSTIVTGFNGFNY